jgi:acetoacetyl-CoA synthetase
MPRWGNRPVGALCTQRDFSGGEDPGHAVRQKARLAIKKPLLGQSLERVINREAMANPGCLAWYVALAKTRESVTLQ